MNINIKELCKQIKKSHCVIWTLENGIHYITNRHWMIKFAELPREVLIQLFSIFTEIPSEGESLICQRDSIDRKPAVRCEFIFEEAMKGPKPGEITEFVKVKDPKLQIRVLNFGTFFCYTNEDYMKILRDFEESKPFGSGVYRPISFNDNTFVILPYRVSNDKADTEMLSELLEDIGA